MNSKLVSIALTTLAAVLFFVSFFVPYYSDKNYAVTKDPKKIELKSGSGISWVDGQVYYRSDVTKNEWKSASMRKINKLYVLSAESQELMALGKNDEVKKLGKEAEELFKEVTEGLTENEVRQLQALNEVQKMSFTPTTALSITFFLGLIAAIVFQAMNGKMSMARDVTIFFYAITLFIGTCLFVVATIISSDESLYWYPESKGRDHGYYLFVSSLIMTLISFVINGLSYVKDQQGKQ